MADRYGEQEGQRLDDRDWIPDVTQAGYVVFSKDKGLRDGEELHAIKSSGAIVFLIPDAGMPSAKQISRYVDHRFRIARRALKSGPAIYVLHPRGVEQVFPPLD